MWAGLLSHTNMESDGTVAATSLPYTTHNLSSDALLEAIFKPKQLQGPRYYHFAKIPDILREEPELRKIARSMFLRDSDFKRYEQYLWLSSAGNVPQPHTAHIFLDVRLFICYITNCLDYCRCKNASPRRCRS